MLGILYLRSENSSRKYFGSASYFYINPSLDCLQSRKYCEAIVDDLLLFMPTKKSHKAKLEDLLKVLLKN